MWVVVTDHNQETITDVTLHLEIPHPKCGFPTLWGPSGIPCRMRNPVHFTGGQYFAFADDFSYSDTFWPILRQKVDLCSMKFHMCMDFFSKYWLYLCSFQLPGKGFLQLVFPFQFLVMGWNMNIETHIFEPIYLQVWHCLLIMYN